MFVGDQHNHVVTVLRHSKFPRQDLRRLPEAHRGVLHPGPVAHGSRGPQPPAHAPGILSPRRGGETINRVDHQASDQGRSESLVSRSEVVCSCGFIVFLGPTLPGCVRVRATENIVVDRRRSVRYAQEQENTGFFSNATMVLYLLGLVGGDTATFSGSRETSLDRSPDERPPKRLDRRIIPVNCEHLHSIIHAHPYTGSGTACFCSTVTRGMES